MNPRLFPFTGWILLAGLACSVSCRKEELPKSAIVEDTNAIAIIAGTVISKDAFVAELKKRFRNGTEGAIATEQRLATLEALIRKEALYAKAKAAGFDQSPEIQARIKSLIVSQFKERQFQPTNAVVSEQEIEASYHANAERYAQPGAVRGAVIFLATPSVATPEQKAELLAEAEEVLREARDTTNDQAFAQIVLRRSGDQATRYRGGDIGWLTRGSLGVEPALTEALFSVTKPGDFAPLVQTARGFYIAKLIEKRNGGRKPLAEVREVIRYQISQQKAEQAEHDFYAAMKEGLDIHVNEAVLETVNLPETAMAKNRPPPSLPAD